MKAPWSTVAVWAWVGILVVLATYELSAAFARSPHVPTLTRFTLRYSPAWVTLPFLGWLFVHFLIRYWRQG